MVDKRKQTKQQSRWANSGSFTENIARLNFTLQTKQGWQKERGGGPTMKDLKFAKQKQIYAQNRRKQEHDVCGI